MAPMRGVIATFKTKHENMELDTDYFAIRYLIILILNIGGLLSSTLILCIQPAVIPWIKNNSLLFNNCNNTANITSENILHLSWAKEENSVLSIHLWVQLLMGIPSAFITQRFGGKYILEYSACFGGFMTLLVPISIDSGIYFFTALRIFISLALSIVPSAIVNIATNWVPKPDKNYMLSLLLSWEELSWVFIPSISIHFSRKDGGKDWAGVFYIFGMITIFWSLICMCTVSHLPTKNKWISEKEKILFQSQSLHGIPKIKSIPWANILKSRPVWGLLLSSFFSSITNSLILQELPNLVRQQFLLAEDDVCLVVAVAKTLQITISVICSLIADWGLTKKRITVTQIRKLSAVIANLLSSCYLIIMASMTCYSWSSFVLLNLIIMNKGINRIGIDNNFIDFAPIYAGAIYALYTSATKAGSLIALIVLPKYVYMNSSIYVCAFACSIGLLIFLTLGNGKSQSWK